MSSLRPASVRLTQPPLGPPSLPPAPEPAQGLDALRSQLDRLWALLARARRHWRWAVVGLAAGAALTALAVSIYQPKYRSETVVFYQPAAQPELAGADAGADPTLMREMMLRHGRLERLVSELNLFSDVLAIEGMTQAVNEVRERINFQAIGKSTFRIAYVGTSAEEAQRVAAWLAGTLTEEDRKRREERVGKTKQFLEGELARRTEELRQREDELERFVATHPQFALTNRQTDAPPPRAQPRASAPARAVPESQADPAPTAAPRPPVEPSAATLAARDEALRELTRSTRSLAEIESRFTDEHPDVKSARAQVAAAEQRLHAANDAIKRETESPPAVAAKGAGDTEIPYLSEEDDKPAQTPAPDELVKAPPKRPLPPAPRPPAPPSGSAEATPPGALAALEAEWMRLTRAVEEARDRQERLSQETFRAGVAARSQLAGHAAEVVVLDEAYLPVEPLRSPRVFVNLGAAMALLLALALSLGRAVLDDRIYDAADLSRLGVEPLLSVVPRKDRDGGGDG